MHHVNINEVTRQRQIKQLNCTQDNSFFPEKGKRAALGGIRTHDTLLSGRALYQLSYQGNSAGRGSNLQHKTLQDKGNLKPLCYSIMALY